MRPHNHPKPIITHGTFCIMIHFELGNFLVPLLAAGETIYCVLRACAQCPACTCWQVMTYESEGQRSDCPSEGYRLFKGCAACGDRCVHNHSSWGPSSGPLVISYYETEAPEVHGIDVFGMNFNMNGTGHGQEERLVAEQCCSKCTFHWPPKDSYLPKQLAERIETSTKPRVLEGL